MGKQKSTKALLAVLTLAFVLPVARHTDAQSKKRNGASAHISAKGRAGTNAQWKADPEKGWVRAEEGHQLHNGSKENIKRNSSTGHNKGYKNKY